MHQGAVAIVFVLAGWLVSGCGDPPGSSVDAGSSQECDLHAELEARPGFPFEPRVFREDVWPVLATSCARSGCHLAPNGAGEFAIWPLSDNPCDFAASFNAVYEKTDFRNDPKNSRVHASVTGSNPAHPPLAGTPSLDVILSYVTSAYRPTSTSSARAIRPSSSISRSMPGPSSQRSTAPAARWAGATTSTVRPAGLP